MTGAT